MVTDLLGTSPREHLPRSCLLARVRGRRGRLADRPEGAAGDPWRRLLEEGRWLYTRLDPRWRREFAPLAGLLETRALATALRLVAGGATPAGTGLMATSLLAPPLVRAIPGGVAAVAAVLAGSNVMVTASGVRGVEGALGDAWLAWGSRHSRDDCIAEFISQLIDRRNLFAFAKGMRWGAPGVPPFLRGGLLSPAQLQRFWRRGDLEGLRRRSPASEEGLAPSLLQRLRRRQAGDPLGAALILDYGVRFWVATAGVEP